MSRLTLEFRAAGGTVVERHKMNAWGQNQGAGGQRVAIPDTADYVLIERDSGEAGRDFELGI